MFIATQTQQQNTMSPPQQQSQLNNSGDNQIMIQTQEHDQLQYHQHHQHQHQHHQLLDQQPSSSPADHMPPALDVNNTSSTSHIMMDHINVVPAPSNTTSATFSSCPANGGSASGVTGDQQTPAKKRTKKACLNCRTSKVACDHSRPCLRCVRHGIEAGCLDVPRKPKIYPKRARSDGKSSDVSSGSSSSASTLMQSIDGAAPVSATSSSAAPKRANKKAKHSSSSPDLLSATIPTTTSTTSSSSTNTPPIIPSSSYQFGSMPDISSLVNSGAIKFHQQLIQQQQQPIQQQHHQQQQQQLDHQQLLYQQYMANAGVVSQPSSPNLLTQLNTSQVFGSHAPNTNDGTNTDASYSYINANNNNNTTNQPFIQYAQHDNQTALQYGTATSTVPHYMHNNQSVANPALSPTSMPSSPVSSLSTPSPSLSAYSGESPGSPTHGGAGHFELGLANNNGHNNGNVIDYNNLQLNNISQCHQPSYDIAGSNNHNNHNNNNEDNNANTSPNSPNSYVHQSSDMIVTHSGPTSNYHADPYSYQQQCATPADQQQQQQIVSYSPQQQQLQLANAPSSSGLNATDMLQSLFGNSILSTINNSAANVYTVLPDILVSEFKKIHQSLENITTFLQFPSVQRPVCLPTPKTALIPGNLWLPCTESVTKNRPFASWGFPNRNLIDTNNVFAKILGFDSEDDLRATSTSPIWDDFVHPQIIPFTNRYAMEAVIKGIKKFQRPCVFKKKHGGYVSATVLVDFDQSYTSFQTIILQKHVELIEDLSSEYIAREYRSKNACLELDDI
ncbi:hypothetical protein SAMD00019534_015700 [Acytostelium subglobosum LB1]|uniref:hypothetical protein n=1 Tax=Acytostelium subglobosum LB1 TaxID=1410327 RepID=UPI0006451807|nr:hypothetical protein SAMD00019534_015700 [Acytostelium subglobosum LB1]GAM18395.1 hypothetical protein SAMD00019534_015700 [Acytostelium subglobosum LB1]|eukprot:XP_012757615.1 hypothetical protein SAMD00019534_015700 [Acytostelium subglobosum LB1]